MRRVVPGARLGRLVPGARLGRLVPGARLGRLLAGFLVVLVACDSRLGTGSVETGRAGWRISVADAVFELGPVPGADGATAPESGGDPAADGEPESGGGPESGPGEENGEENGEAKLETPFVLLWDGELDCAAPKPETGRGWLLAAWMGAPDGSPLAWGAGRYTAPCLASDTVCAELRLFEVVVDAPGNVRLTAVPVTEGEIILDEIEPWLWTRGSFDLSAGGEGLRGEFFARHCPGLRRALSLDEVLP